MEDEHLDILQTSDMELLPPSSSSSLLEEEDPGQQSDPDYFPEEDVMELEEFQSIDVHTLDDYLHHITAHDAATMAISNENTNQEPPKDLDHLLAVDLECPHVDHEDDDDDNVVTHNEQQSPIDIKIEVQQITPPNHDQVKESRRNPRKQTLSTRDVPEEPAKKAKVEESSPVVVVVVDYSGMSEAEVIQNKVPLYKLNPMDPKWTEPFRKRIEKAISSKGHHDQTKEEAALYRKLRRIPQVWNAMKPFLTPRERRL